MRIPPATGATGSSYPGNRFAIAPNLAAETYPSSTELAIDLVAHPDPLKRIPGKAFGSPPLPAYPAAKGDGEAPTGQTDSPPVDCDRSWDIFQVGIQFSAS